MGGSWCSGVIASVYLIYMSSNTRTYIWVRRELLNTVGNGPSIPARIPQEDSMGHRSLLFQKAGLSHTLTVWTSHPAECDLAVLLPYSVAPTCRPSPSSDARWSVSTLVRELAVLNFPGAGTATSAWFTVMPSLRLRGQKDTREKKGIKLQHRVLKCLLRRQVKYVEDFREDCNSPWLARGGLRLWVCASEFQPVF